VAKVTDWRREELEGGAGSGAGSLGEDQRERGGSQRDGELKRPLIRGD
jgi:hypothetical protein